MVYILVLTFVSNIDYGIYSSFNICIKYRLSLKYRLYFILYFNDNLYLIQMLKYRENIESCSCSIEQLQGLKKIFFIFNKKMEKLTHTLTSKISSYIETPLSITNSRYYDDYVRGGYQKFKNYIVKNYPDIKIPEYDTTTN